MRHFLIDTDTAGDDTTALLMLARTTNIALEGVTTVAGNVDVRQATENALYTLQMADRTSRVPVYAGANRPLLYPLQTATDVHGADGMGNAHYPPASQRPEQSHAVQAICRLADQWAGRLEIVAIGPLTNIALAVRLDPLLPQKIRHLWVMGGAIHAQGNVTPAAEFNFYVDPHAAQIVLDAGFPLTLLGWEICIRDGVLSDAFFDEIEGLQTPLASFFLQTNRLVRAFDKSHGVAGATQPDALLTAVALQPTLATKNAPAFLQIAVDDLTTRGMSVADLLLLDRTQNATVVREVNAAAFQQKMRDLLEGNPLVAQEI